MVYELGDIETSQKGYKKVTAGQGPDHAPTRPSEEHQPQRGYFVYLIESGEGLHEGMELTKVFTSAGVPFSYERPLNSVDFRRCLTEDLALALARLAAEDRLAGSEIPILHVSAHSFLPRRRDNRPSPSGIELRNGDVIRWPQFRREVSALNDAFGSRLVLCLSVCDGIQADTIAMRTDRPNPPCHAMVANSKQVKVGASETAFVAFYERLFAGASLREAVSEMRVASGNDDFILHYGHQTTTAFSRLMASVRDGKLGDEIRDLYSPRGGP